MKKFKIYIALGLSVALIFGACHDLDDLNVNPNGPAPETTDLNLLLPTFLVQVGQRVVELGYGDLAGTMQHTQKNGWNGGHNNYEWTNQSHSWQSYYSILRQVDEFHQKAKEDNLLFHQGVALTMKAYVFGLITDLWGDAPFSQALMAEQGSTYYTPVFDPQRDIYLGILEYLEQANTFFSHSPDQYIQINAQQDVLYGGNVTKWRKLANSLALRYYMRLSAKEPGIAEAGITRIASDPAAYPIITSAADDANIGYIGSSLTDSWPGNMVFNPDQYGEYMRRKMASTLVEAMQANDDPRLAVWAEKVETPIEVLAAGTEIDQIVGGKRQVSPDVAAAYEDLVGFPIDEDEEYVGIPPSLATPSAYNLAPDLAQGAYNPHVSQLNPMYKEAAGPLLQMRLLSAAEVHFILAEAATYNWAPGDAQTHFENGIRESLIAWGVGAQFDDFIEDVSYNGLESIITQKWIASWTAAAESWFDYRRTGYPELQTGPAAVREALPLRFNYHFVDEISRNTSNAEAAIERLQPTEFKGTDQTNNSAWSKMWLLQGTGKPY
jgi:hypothetical protein